MRLHVNREADQPSTTAVAAKSLPLGAALFLFAATFVIVLGGGACVLDLDHLSDGDGGNAGDGAANGEGGAADASTDGTTEASTDGGSCPSLHGPAPVRITGAGGASFCIDSTEATAGQYAEFLQAKGGDTNGQPAECAWNTSFAPLTAPGSLPSNRAIGGVDWCDAVAFCAWSGKSLCGDLTGAAVDIALANDPAKSAWFAACSANGARAFPYGSSADTSACNGMDRTSTPSDVKSSPKCEGGFPGVFDLVGNVEEWTASCESGGGDPAQRGCLARGGHYTSKIEDLECKTAAVHVEARSLAEPWRGIRCCSY